MAREESKARAGLVIALTILGFPIVWPLHVVRSAIFGWRHRARMARAVSEKEATRVLTRVRAGEASRAIVSTRTSSSIASGPEEEMCLELVLGAENVVVRASPEFEGATRERGVPIREEESQAAGLGTTFAWAIWLVSILALTSILTSSYFLGVAATISIAGLLAFALT